MAKHWFHDKTPAQKKEYILKHPNSIYAKQAKAARGDEQRAKTKKNTKKAHHARIKARMEAREARNAAH